MNFGVTGDGKDKGSVDVVMTDLNGVKHPIDIRYQADTSAGETEKDFVPTGFIENPGVELAALNMEKVDGKFKGTAEFNGKNYEYTPYTYTVTETGVYTFEFHSYYKTGATGKNIPRNDINMPSSKTGHKYNGADIGGWIAALDITVFDESGEKQHGRTYADYLALEMGPSGSNGVRDAYYILTTDSYKMQFNNVSPYTYNFFANNKGLYDSATGEIIYSSVKDVNNENTYARMGAAYKYPGTKDTDMLKSYYIFLEYPDDQLEGEMYEKPVPPDPATNLRFVSQITDDKGNKVTGAYEGEGGYFAFDVEEATTATLRLEFKGALGDYAPVEISGAVTPHTTNYFYWNGKDGNGKVIPHDTYSINDLAFTVTTKAGEIHFPIIDMEYARGGITFERMSHIYDKNGVQLDSEDNIYGKTKNLIYYDDTAIYYGEMPASTGFSESDMTLALNKNDEPWKTQIANSNDVYYNNVNNAPKSFFKNNSGQYWTYNNMRSDNANEGGEYLARQSNYIKTLHPEIRVGDHSHTTNVVDYFDEKGNLIETPTGDQQQMINYLNSATYPVGKSTGTGITYADNHTGITDAEKYVWTNVKNAQSTTDYTIANFWTFIPSQPATASTEIPNITIKERPENSFSLTGRVFFDADENKIFEDMTDKGDYALSGVTLNLYKKSSDTSFNAGKTYVSYDASNNTVKILDSSSFGGATEKYELVDTGKTAGDGMYKFTGLEYDPTGGTDYLYQVVKPLDNYNLKTGGKNAAAIQSGTTGVYYGYYADKSYNTTYKGTEVQHIIVGGTGADHVDPTKITCNGKENESHTVCAVDVGYNYAVMKQSLELKKAWDTADETTHPTAVAYEISYHLENSTEDNLYKYRVISAIDAWSYEDEYLPTVLDGKDVNNYYVSAEYYISTDGKTIYKHEFDYNSSAGKYESFVGEVYSAPITALNELTKTEVKNFSNIPDLSVLKSLTWTKVTEGEPYRAVLDRNVGSDKSTITVTNAKEHGTIEIFKYYDDPLEKNALQGATFRIYELKDGVDLTEIKKLASSGNTEDLKTLQGYQVGSGTTRANGRIAFPGLDPTKTYVVREMYPPAGYRILNEFYEVKPNSAIGSKTPKEIEDDNGKGIYYFNDDNYVEVKVGNAPADSNFYILKRIEGRAWQTNDSFSFSIKNAFDRSEASSNITAADGITIDLEEYSNIYESNSTTVLDKAGTFAEHFHKDATMTGDKVTVTVDNHCDYYSYEAADQHVPDKTNTYTYPDRKMSDKLLTDGKGAGEGDPTFCGVKFPFAGTYTFTITENDIEDDTKETLTKSEREYTVTITVKRVRKEGSEEDTETTTENSHLEAEVSSITYKDGTEGVSQIFAGSSPLFTNTYAPAPAKQDTGYNIVKNFTGRTDNAWLDDDKFTIRVSGVDADTQNAIKNGNLVIDGFNGKLDSTGTTSEWVYTFNSTNKDTPWNFSSFTFNNIMFPVQYVLNGKDPTDPDNVWQSTEDNPTPSQDQIGSGKDQYSPQTVPVTYWLKIAEDIPADVKGIDYDDQVYYLQIILRNAEETVSTGTAGKEEEDGIIDEIDMYLYHVDKSVTDVTKLTDGDIVATCYTEAVVLDKDNWTDKPTEGNITEYSWFYVKNDNTLEPKSNGEVPESDPTEGEYKLLVRRYEEHGGEADGHTMTFSNVYHTSYSWAPQVKKTLNGREWLDTDKFTFKIECTDTDKPGVKMPTNDTIEINKGTIGYTKTFSAIEFSIPGDYHFTITETDNYGHTLATYNVIVTVADNNDGTLTPAIKGSDSSVISEDYFEFVNTYESTSFDLSISKAIIGRDWNGGEKFTFKIHPDDDTLKAIKDGIITMPKAVGELSDGSYTVTIGKDNYVDDEKLAIKDLDKITINNTGSITEVTQYKFTISEVTDGLDLEEMYCREPSIDLFITVDPKVTSGSSSYANQFVATYAHRVSGEDTSVGSSDANKVTIPFENVALGKLTVANKVVTSAAEDKTEFTFVVEFTYADDKDHNIKASSTELVPEKSSDDKKWTYTFTLRDGESVEFSNIPPNTEYTITETVSEKYMLLRVRDHLTDDGGTVDLTGTSVSGTIKPPESTGEENHQYRLFVNGLIKDLPSSGGIGTWRYIFLGTVLTVVALLLFAVLYSDRRTRKGSND